MHNPNRKCTGNLGNKYLIEDPLRPRCNAPIMVHLVDAAGQDVVDIDELQVEVSILNGVLYEEMHAERPDAAPRPPPTDADHEAIVVLNNKDGVPLLMQRPDPNMPSASSPDPGPITFELQVLGVKHPCMICVMMITTPPCYSTALPNCPTCMQPRQVRPCYLAASRHTACLCDPSRGPPHPTLLSLALCLSPLSLPPSVSALQVATLCHSTVFLLHIMTHLCWWIADHDDRCVLGDCCS